MKRWKAILAATLIFATGVVTGALGVKIAAAKARHAREGFPASMMDARFDALKRMQRELALSPEQADRIDAILQQGRKRTRLLWDSCQPQVKEELKRVREGIQAKLLPEQRARFELLLQRSRDRRGSPVPGDGHKQPWRRDERGGNGPEEGKTASPQP